MRAALSQLPSAVVDNLQAVQANPRAYHATMRRGGTRKGLAIAGLITSGVFLLVLGMVALLEYIPFAVGIIYGSAVGFAALWSIDRLKLVAAAPVKPMLLLNPLYLTRVTLKEVHSYRLWTDDVRDLRVTPHRGPGGVHVATRFDLLLRDGTRAAFVVRDEALGNHLAGAITRYRAEISGGAPLPEAYDLFQAMNEAPAGPAPSTTGRKILVWSVGAAAGAVLGLGAAFGSYAMEQSRYLDYTRSVRGAELYFARYALPLFEERAREVLVKAYEDRWQRGKTSVARLREMARLQDVPHVTAAQKKQILALYREGSRRELRKLYQQAIERYKKVALTADPDARHAIIRMMELARDRGYYRVRVSYTRATDRIRSVRLRRRHRGRYLVPMAPSFSVRLNRSRERLITRRITNAFRKIVPQNILEFPGQSRRPRRHGTYGRRATYGRRGRLAGLLASAGSRVRAATDRAREKGPAQIEFKVSYVVFPSTTVYSSRRNRSRLYSGVGFDWDLRILVKGKQLYHLKERSFPPPRFSVSRYRRHGNLAAGTVYSRMATTAFDNFGRKMVKHFGVDARSRWRNLKSQRLRYRTRGRAL